MDTTREVFLINYGNTLGPRVLGIKIKDEILEYLKQNKDSEVIFNFSGVTVISTGFSKELFGGLWKSLGDEFKIKIKLKITGNEKIIKNAILLGIQAVKNNED